MTTVNYDFSRYVYVAWWVYRYVCSVDSYFVMYSILYSWGSKDSLTIASICLYTSCSGSITTATADPPYTKQ